MNSGDTVEHRGWKRDVLLDSSLQVVDSVDFWEQEHFGVGSPQNNDFVSLLFHVSDVLSDDVDEFLVCSSEQIICPIALVRGDVVRIEYSRQWPDVLKFVFQLFDERGLKDFGAFGSFVEVNI